VLRPGDLASNPPLRDVVGEALRVRDAFLGRETFLVREALLARPFFAVRLLLFRVFRLALAIASLPQNQWPESALYMGGSDVTAIRVCP